MGPLTHSEILQYLSMVLKHSTLAVFPNLIGQHLMPFSDTKTQPASEQQLAAGPE